LLDFDLCLSHGDVLFPDIKKGMSLLLRGSQRLSSVETALIYLITTVREEPFLEFLPGDFFREKGLLCHKEDLLFTGLGIE